MLEGRESRFRNVFKDLDCQLASYFHSMFCLIGLEQQDVTQVCSGRQPSGNRETTRPALANQRIRRETSFRV